MICACMHACMHACLHVCLCECVHACNNKGTVCIIISKNRCKGECNDQTEVL